MRLSSFNCLLGVTTSITPDALTNDSVVTVAYESASDPTALIVVSFKYIDGSILQATSVYKGVSGYALSIASKVEWLAPQFPGSSGVIWTSPVIRFVLGFQSDAIDIEFVFQSG